MNEKRSSWVLVVAAGVTVGLILVLGFGLLLWLTGWLGGGGAEARFESNGEQIYFTATSQHGTPVTSDSRPGMGRMRGDDLSCASCHGAGGRGGQIQMMMRIIDAPDIRYDVLTGEDHAEHGEEGEEGHEPYTEQTIKRAITDGVDPSGERLDWPMPRWSMGEEDMDDLVEFLKTLD